MTRMKSRTSNPCDNWNKSDPKIKTKTPARIGNQGEPIAELTKFGWIIMSLVYIAYFLPHSPWLLLF